MEEQKSWALVPGWGVRLSFSVFKMDGINRC